MSVAAVQYERSGGGGIIFFSINQKLRVLHVCVLAAGMVVCWTCHLCCIEEAPKNDAYCKEVWYGCSFVGGCHERFVTCQWKTTLAVSVARVECPHHLESSLFQVCCCRCLAAVRLAHRFLFLLFPCCEGSFAASEPLISSRARRAFEDDVEAECLHLSGDAKAPTPSRSRRSVRCGDAHVNSRSGWASRRPLDALNGLVAGGLRQL